MNLRWILEKAIETGAADIFIVPGYYVSMKIGGAVTPVSAERLLPADCEAIIREIYASDNQRLMERLYKTGDDDFSFSIRDLGRFRCNAYKQRNSLASVLRVVAFGLPDPSVLHIPRVVMDLYTKRRGLILVTGPAGHGKSTTLACLIDKINSARSDHIITLEDPIEFLHPHKKSIVSQREITHDTESYACALRAALRQSPNAILLGEMRDFETIATALTAAETGQLILSTLHTVGAAKTIDRILDVFPAPQQQQVRIQLSLVLQAVVSQQLIPTVDGGLTPAFEIMIANSAIQNMIREGKVHQMDNVIYAGVSEGMVTMDADILRLCQQKRISRENALLYSINAELMARKLAL
ncbi:MAG: PilT/PilU family type 4a pilus ATPase [Firmicutes bacterium]|nr:PilT/PilU family type 4a pilus ATPase [Bacillota bacterium]